MRKLTMQPTSADLTLQAVFDKFISFKKIKNLSQVSIDYYEECFKFFTEYYPATSPCSEITKDICLGYVQHLRETRSNVKDTTINTYLRSRMLCSYRFPGCPPTFLPSKHPVCVRKY